MKYELLGGATAVAAPSRIRAFAEEIIPAFA